MQTNTWGGGRVVLGVGAPLGLQFSIALCVGMVAATFSPSVRRSIPRWFEVAIWVALIFVCWLGIASIREAPARELTSAVNWAVGQILSTLIALVGQSIIGTLSAHRFGLATALVIIVGVDVLALALIVSHRRAKAFEPKVRLRDWVELPAQYVTAPVAAKVVPSGVDELNERLAAATAVAGAAAATWSVQFLIWARDAGLPRAEQRLALAVAMGRVETKVWLESVRETARELDAAAHTRFAGTTPEVNRLALRVAAILNGVTDAEQRITPGAKNFAQVVDIQALRIAQTLGRIGRSTSSNEKEEEIGPDHPDRLAS